MSSAAAMILALAAHVGGQAPRMLAYSASPSRYITAHAPQIAKLYDGLFLIVGDWDGGVAGKLATGDGTPADTEWRRLAAENARALKQAGAGESVLGVSFDENGPWPSPETLEDTAFTQRMVRRFSALGSAARGMGLRGVSIDIEYPYRRYSLEHPVYAGCARSAEDLLDAARRQGRAIMSSVLDAFPDAVVWILPGDLSAHGIGGALMLGMLATMAERDAPGGMHLGYERSYGLSDPASQAGIARCGDCLAGEVLGPREFDYWKRRCTVAPGVWPLHMVETGGKDYPARPWDEELEELREQMRILRATAKRYLWSFTAYPVWGPSDPEELVRWGFPKPSFAAAREAIAGWHGVLQDRARPSDRRMNRLLKAVGDFDAGRIGPEGLCDRFGTPARWLVLGLLGNPNTQPLYTAPSAANGPVRLEETHQGRDGLVRWFPFANLDPLGQVRLRSAFGYRGTDDCSVYLVCDIVATKETRGLLWLNWDDGAVVRLNGRILVDHSAYPERGHGLLYRDRYLFEDRVPVVVPRGRSRLSVTSVNARGSWGVTLRFADADGYPLPGLRFEMPRPVAAPTKVDLRTPSRGCAGLQQSQNAD